MLGRRRSGFTWVELAVCIAIVLLLLALLLPSVRSAREPARRNTCNSNLHVVGLAMMNYVSGSGGEYPGYLEPLELSVGDAGGSVVESRRVTWVVPMLPHVERADLYREFRSGRFPEDKPAEAKVDERSLYMSLLVCPSNPPQTSFPPPCSYAVNTGQPDVPAFAGDEERKGYPCDWPANGVFFNRFIHGEVNPVGAPLATMTQDFIFERDGTSNTLLASERIDAGSWVFPPAAPLEAEAALGFVWRPSASSRPPFEPPLPSQRINGPADSAPINNARPSSNHPGGAMVLFCDGHTRFISQDIDYGVYCLLMTPDARECNAPGQTELVKPSRANNYGYLRTEQFTQNALE